MSTVYVEKIDDLNSTVSTLFTSSSFTSMPFYVPLSFPAPNRRYRISMGGDSTTTIANVTLMWRLLTNTIQINTFSDPSNLLNLGDVFNPGDSAHTLGGTTLSEPYLDVYVTDYSRTTAFKGTALTTTWQEYTVLGVGTPFTRPAQINLDINGKIYVADSGAHQIWRMDDILGTNLVQYGAVGGGVGQLFNPQGVVVDRSGHIYISDTGNNRIVRIDDMVGTNWTTFGSLGSGYQQFNSPQMLSLDKYGRVYIADGLNNRIIRIDDMTGKGWIVLA